MQKKFIILLLFLLVVLTGCSDNSSSSVYSKAEFSAAPDGWYVLHEDETFEPLFNLEVSDNLTNNIASGVNTPIRFLSNSNIPIVGKNDSIIVKSEKAPNAYTPLYELEDQGFTMGFSVASASSKGGYLFRTDQDGLTEGSAAYKLLKDINAGDSLVRSVGGQNFTEDILNPSSLSVSGLEDGGKYQIVWYQGTKERVANVDADCRQLLAKTGFTYTFSDVKYTSDEYAIMVLPKDLSSGYYYVDDDKEDSGLFKLEK